MSWLDKLERKLGRFAIPGLMRVVVIGMALVFCCELLFPQALLGYYLSFLPELIAQGQVWRVFTFIFLPPESSLLFIVFALYFYYFIGNALENEWGSFRFTLYYLLGVVGTIIAMIVEDAPDGVYNVANPDNEVSMVEVADALIESDAAFTTSLGDGIGIVFEPEDKPRIELYDDGYQPVKRVAPTKPMMMGYHIPTCGLKKIIKDAARNVR